MEVGIMGNRYNYHNCLLLVIPQAFQGIANCPEECSIAK